MGMDVDAGMTAEAGLGQVAPGAESGQAELDQAGLEVIGMRLADRAYLQGVFHVAFGCVPSAQMMRTLGSEQTLACLDRLGQASAGMPDGATVEVGMGDERHAVPASQVIDETRALLARMAERADDPAAVDDLKEAYTRLLRVPGDAYVHPWEAPYVGKESMIFQESTLDVRKRFAAYGYVSAAYKHFPEDHISALLDFLARLSSTAYEAFADGDDARVREVLRSQQQMVDGHILTWIDKFGQGLWLKDRSRAYFQLWCALRVFLLVDGAFMEKMLA